MAESGKPEPVVSEESRPFWDAAREGRLVAPFCGTCGHYFFYPRARCPVCWNGGWEWRPCSGRGEIYSFTIVRRSPFPAFEAEGPYVVALVQLAEGVRLMGNIVGAEPEQIRIGQPVAVRFEARGEWFLPQFAPVSSEERS